MNLIVALDLESVGGERLPQSLGIAAKFRPHITLLGRSTLAAGRPFPQVAQRFRLAASGRTWPILELQGPILAAPQLAWFESLPGAPGWRDLVEAHASWCELARDLGLTDPRRGAFSGGAYRPHMTTSWGVPLGEQPFGPPSLVYVRPVATALYTYDEDPERDTVERLLLAHASA